MHETQEHGPLHAGRRRSLSGTVSLLWLAALWLAGAEPGDRAPALIAVGFGLTAWRRGPASVSFERALEDRTRRYEEEIASLLCEEKAHRERALQLQLQQVSLMRLAGARERRPVNLAAAFKEIAESGALVLAIDRVSVWMIDAADPGQIRCADMFERADHRHSSGGSRNTREHPRFWKAAAENRTLAAYDIRMDPNVRDYGAKYLVPDGVRSILTAPVRFAGDVRGFLLFEQKDCPRNWTTEDQIFAGSLADMASLAIEENERRRVEQDLREKSHRLIEAQEVERRRVARELHDSVNQILSSARFRVQFFLEQSGDAKPAVLESAGQARSLLERAIQEVRIISENLRPSELDDLGLLAAIRSGCDDFRERTGVDLRVSVGGFPDRLPPDTELSLYRLVQEALSNVERHSRASRVLVKLDGARDRFSISIRDDGVGFNSTGPPIPHPVSGTRRGYGLANMRERVELLGGRFTLRTSPGSGTRLRIEIPRAVDGPGKWEGLAET